MFTIRQGHTDAFSAQAKMTFEEAAVAHLHEKLADRVRGQSELELKEWIRDAVARAEPFGLVTQQQIMCFVDSEALLGKCFYRSPEHAWASRVLESEHLQAGDKAGLLLATACSFFREKNVSEK